MREKEISNELPPKYRSWNHLMADIKDRMIDNTTQVVQFAVIDKEEITRYTFKLDYIKARAYDEFFEGYLKIAFDPYEYCPASYIIHQVDYILAYNGRKHG